LRFFFVKVLHRPYQQLDLIYPKLPVRLPTVLSEDEVTKLIESASNAYHRVILTTLYTTGMRRTELSRLKVEDIDSQRMVIHVRQGKGALAVASGGPKLQRSAIAEKDCSFDAGQQACHDFVNGLGHPLNAKAIDMDDVANYVSSAFTMFLKFFSICRVLLHLVIPGIKPSLPSYQH
jgi:site-specific recombinase XerC